MTSDREETIGGAADKKDLILSSNGLFDSSLRFTVMMILIFYKKAGFTELQKLLGATAGNLNYHLRKLEDKKYIQIEKAFFFTRPITVIKITKKGEDSFREYACKLRTLLDKLG